MDLGTIKKKLINNKYDTVEGVIDDIQLIWDNCKVYNEVNSWIHSIAEKLERSFKKMIKNYFSMIDLPLTTLASIILLIKIRVREQKVMKGKKRLKYLTTIE